MPRQRASIASAFRERKLPMEEKKELLDQDERVVEIELERLRVLKDDEAVVSMVDSNL